MKKKLLSILLTLAMVVSMMPAMTLTAMAETTTHTHVGMTPIANENALKDLFSNGGSGYLTSDITVSGNLTVSAANVKLCLNDKVINFNGNNYYIVVNASSTFELFDCGTTKRYYTKDPTRGAWTLKNDGSITEYSTTGGIITGAQYCPLQVNLNGKLTISGGNIVGNGSKTSYRTGGLYNSGNVTMNGGAFIGNAGGPGGVYVNENATFTMNNGKISNNTGDSFAGGVSVSTKGTFTMNGGEISNNMLTSQSGNGAGIYISGGSVNMHDGEIKNNTATNRGGGVYVSSGNFTMNNGTISENYASGIGGGVFIDSRSNFEMLGGKIKNNKAQTAGGIYASGTSDSGASSYYIKIKGGKIIDNEANSVGGVSVNYLNFEMSGGEISGNKASNYGAVYVGSNSHFKMSGGKIVDNIGDSTCAGVYVTGSQSSAIIGGTSIILGNTVNKKENNLFIYNKSNNTIGLGKGIDQNGVPVPAEGMGVGVTIDAKTGDFTDATATEGALKYFFADDPTQYAVKFESNKLKLVGVTKITPTVSLDGWTYGDTPKTPTVTGNTGKATPVYSYAVKDSDEFSTTVPIDAGEYTVKAEIPQITTYGSGTATADFIIRKKNITSLTVAGTSADYDGQAHKISITSTPTLSADKFNVKYYKIDEDDGSIGKAVSQASSIGKYIYVIETKNYDLPGDVFTGTPTSESDVTGKSNAGILTISVKIPAQQKPISFQNGLVEKLVTDSKFTNTLTNENTGATTTYTSSNTGVATVDSSSGEVTIKGAGSTTITAKSSLTDTTDVYAAYTLNVSKKEVTVTVKNESIAYGAASPYVNGSFEKLTLSDNNAKTGLTPAFTTSYKVGSSVNEYSVKVSLGTSDKYKFIYEPGTLTVNPKKLSLSDFDISVADKNYDGNNTASVTATVKSTSLVSGDSLNATATGTFASANASTSAQNVNYTITGISGAKAGNYVLDSNMSSTKSNAAKINSMPISFTFGTAEFGYDGSKKPVSVTAVDANNALFTGYTVYYKNSKNSESTTAPTEVGTYTVTAKLKNTTNYSTTANTATLKINPGNAVVWASAGTDNVYDGNAKNITAMSSPKLNLAVTYYSIDTSGNVGSVVTSPTNVGKYLYVINLNNNNNYVIGGAISGTPSGNAVSLVTNNSNVGIMTIANNAQTPLSVDQSVYNKTYGDGNFTPKVEGGVSGATKTTSIVSGDCVSIVNATTGELKVEKPGTAVIKVTATKSGYADASVQYTVIVGKKPVTVTVNDDNITYGADSPYVQGSLSKLSFSDSSAKTGLESTFTTSYIKGKSIGEYSVRVNLGTSDKYDFVYVPGTLTVNPKELKAEDFTVTAGSKKYDGTDNAIVTATAKRTSLILEDTLNVAATGKFADAKAGNGKTVTYEITGISGTKAGNYTIGTIKGSTKANIEKMKLSFSFGITTFSYDGSAKPVSVSAVDEKMTLFTDYTVKYKGNSPTTDTESTTAPDNVGEYTVTAYYDAANYELASSNTNTATLKITAGNVVVWATSGTEHKYSDTDKTITAMSMPKLALDVTYYSIKDGKVGDSVATPSAIGNYLYVITLADNDANKNYTIGEALSGTPAKDTLVSELSGSNIGIMTIAESVQPALTVDKSIVNLTYDKDLKYTQTASGGASGAKITYSIPNDAEKAYATVNSNTGELSILKPGTVVVQATSKATGYADATVKYTVVIAKKTINVKVNNQKITYGAANPYDALADLTFPESFDTTGLNPTFETSYAPGKGVNDYAVRAKITENDYYVFDCETGTLTVEPKTLNVNEDASKSDFTVTADDKVYDGTKSAVVSATTKAASLYTGDTLDVTATGSFENENVADSKTVNYKITGITGSKARNYELGTVEGTTTANITKMPITFTMGETAFSYDGKAKPVTVTAVDQNGKNFTGFKVEYEGTSGTEYTKSTNAPSECGKYAISVSLIDDSNYAIQNSKDITGKTLEIGSMQVTFSFGTNSFIYDGTAKKVEVSAVDANRNVFKDFKVKYKGASDTTYEESETAPTDVGTYTVTVEYDTTKYGTAATNTTTLKINPANVVVWANGGTEHSFEDVNKTINAKSTPALDLDVTYYNITGEKKVGSTVTPSAVGDYLYVIKLANNDTNKNYVIGNALNTTSISDQSIDSLEGSNFGIMTIADNIQPALTVEHDVYNKTYGDAAFKPSVTGGAGTITYSNVNESEKDIAEINATSGEITIKKPGTAVFEAKSVAEGYVDATVRYSVVIAKKPIDVEVKDQSITYGDANPYTPNATLSEILEFSETLADGTDTTPTFKTLYAAGDKVGKYDVSVSLPDSEYYSYNYTAGTLTVNQKPLVVNDFTVTATGKVYDGTDTVSLTANVKSGMLFGTDTLNVSVEGHFVDANAADSKTVNYTITGISGTKAENYALSGSMQGTTTAKITKKKVTFSMGETTFTYDGSKKPVSVTAVYDNGKSFTDFVVKYNDQAEAPSNAGTYPISVTLNDATNYEIANTSVTDNKNLVINQMPITFQVGETSFIYDGNPKPVTITAEDANGRNFTAFTVKYKESTTAPSIVGEYPITITLNDTTNYKVANESAITGKKLSISKGDIVFSFGPSEFTYDGSKKSVAVSAIDADNRVFTDYKVYYEGIYGTSYSKSETAPTKVGTYKVSAEFTSSKYSCEAGSNTTTMTIKPGKVVVWANSGTQHLYTDTDKTIKAMSVPDLNLDVTYYTISDNGYVGNKIAKPSDRGKYLYVITLKNDSTNKNYVIDDALNISPITKKADLLNYSNVGIMTIDDSVQPELTVNDYVITKTYGDGKFTPKVSGGAPGAKITYSIPNAAERNYASVNETTGEITIKKPGIVVVEATAKADNYEDISVRYTVVINKKVVDIELGDSIQYTGKTEVTPYKVTGDIAGNRVKTSDIKFVYQKIDDTEVGTFHDAGKYYVTAEIPSSNEYYCTNGAASGIVAITKAPLTLTADDKTATYGDAEPIYTFTATGLLNEDTVASLGGTAKYTCDYKQFSDAGEYAIKLSEVTSDNYEITFVDGKLTVSPLPVVLSWSNNTFTYDGKEHSMTATVENAVNGDKVKINAYTDGKATNVGNYEAVATSVDDENYTLVGGSNLSQAWSITEKTVTVKPARVLANVNGKATLSLDVTTLLEGDREFTGTPEFIITKADGSEVTLANALKTSGTYTITWKNPEDIKFNSNYSVITNTNGQLIVIAPKTPVEVVKAATSGSKKVKLTWLEVSGATSYEVYGQQCGKKYKKITTTSKNTYTVKKIGGKKLKAHKYYKFYVVAYTANGQVKSNDIHFITGKTKGKYANAKSIKVNYSAVTLQPGQAIGLNLTTKIYKSKKHINKSHGVATRYISDNPTVATVNASGVVTAKMGGSATIYVQDAGGLYCTTTVNVPY